MEARSCACRFSQRISLSDVAARRARDECIATPKRLYNKLLQLVLPATL
eukprot:COSAG02_NODE_57308_length_281_cov_0.582418_1_plen_48_part_01